MAITRQLLGCESKSIAHISQHERDGYEATVRNDSNAPGAFTTPKTKPPGNRSASRPATGRGRAKAPGAQRTERQPHFNLALARVYINGADPKLATRTWQEVMEHIVEKKTDETRRRWDVAIKDKNFDCIRNLQVAETRPEHFDRALADGKVSTNVYLRRIHNHALGMDWLLKSVIPRLQWPRPVFKPKRAITSKSTQNHRGRSRRGTTEPGSRNSDQRYTTSAATSTNCSGTPAPRRPTRPA